MPKLTQYTCEQTQEILYSLDESNLKRKNINHIWPHKFEKGIIDYTKILSIKKAHKYLLF
ncbi:hypothetical protein HZS_6304 [Henneguya salminicola]|nr:hypothetical protein HZS_6304 [Henneguya salminicola]